MLTDLDPRVTAHINLFAVLGALGPMARLVPSAKAILSEVTVSTAVVFKVPGVPHHAYTFTNEAITPGKAQGARAVTLHFTSVAHFNKMIEGTARSMGLEVVD